MKHQKKKYSKPQRPFDKVRIDEENVLRERYGLKNKKEIWKADSAIGRIRNQAKKLITADDEAKQEFAEKLRKRGFEVENIADALALDKEDWLKRRLQTLVFKKGFANTPKQARQFITHRHISIGNQIINKPSYQVGLKEEGDIMVNLSLKEKQDKKDKIEEIKKEVLDKEVKGKVETPSEIQESPQVENKNGRAIEVEAK